MANMVFTASRSAGDDINVPISIPFTVGGTATFTATATSVSDYTVTGAATFTATNGSMTIPAGQASAAITISTIPDTTPEADETIILTPTAQTGSWVVGTSAWTGTILNDDVGDPLFANVVLLMPLSSTSGLSDVKGRLAANSGSANSTAIVDPFGNNTGVRSFTGADFFTVTRDTALELPGDFSIEVFFYPTANTPPASLWGLMHTRSGVIAQPFQLECSNNGSINYYDGGTYPTPASAFLLNRWNYLNLNRSGSQMKLQVNGVTGFSQVNTTSLNFPGNLVFGEIINAGYGGLTGYASNLRITRAYRDGSIVPSIAFPTTV